MKERAREDGKAKVQGVEVLSNSNLEGLELD